MLLRYCYGAFLFVFLKVNYAQGTVIEGPNNVIYIPGETPLPITLICNVIGFATWEVNNVTFTIPNINNGNLPGHRTSGTNILVDAPMNNTKYICVSNNQTNEIDRSEPAFLYVAAAPDQVPDVMVIIDSITLNDDNIVTLMLSWGEPFNNFDPIVNYTVNVTYPDGIARNFTTTDNTTRSYTITDLISMTNYTFSVVATNCISSGEAGVVMITTPSLPGMVTGVMLTCEVVNEQFNLCSIQWDQVIVGNGPFEQPLLYEVYHGTSITEVNSPTTTLMFDGSLPVGDFVGKVTVSVTARNIFGRGNSSDVDEFEIMSSAVQMTMITLGDYVDSTYSITVTCTIIPESMADVCVVSAISDNRNITGIALVNDNEMATVTINGLACGVTYTIIAGGTLNGDLMGLRLFRDYTVGPCISVTSTTTAIIASETSSVATTMMPSAPSTGTSTDDNSDNTGAIVGGVIGGILGAIVVIIIIILVVYCCMKHREKSSKPRNTPMAMNDIPLYDAVQDPAVSDTVKMKPNPAYQGLPSDHVKMETNPAYKVLTSNQANKEPDPAHQDLSSYTGRASISKQKPAGDVNYYEDIINDQNIAMTKNPSYAVP